MNKTQTKITDEYLARRNQLEGKITKKAALLYASFDVLVRDYLLKHGAQAKSGKPWDEYVIETSVGPLTIHPFEGWIATRFDDAKRAAERLGSAVNPYSGKWNFHFDTFRDERDIENALKHFAWHLERILGHASYTSHATAFASRRAMIEISARDPRGGLGAHAKVPARALSDSHAPLVVTSTRPGMYAITHRPSGAGVAFFVRSKDAKAALPELLPLTNWNRDMEAVAQTPGLLDQVKAIERRHRNV